MNETRNQSDRANVPLSIRRRLVTVGSKYNNSQNIIEIIIASFTGVIVKTYFRHTSCILLYVHLLQVIIQVWLIPRDRGPNQLPRCGCSQRRLRVHGPS